MINKWSADPIPNDRASMTAARRGPQFIAQSLMFDTPLSSGDPPESVGFVLPVERPSEYFAMIAPAAAAAQDAGGRVDLWTLAEAVPVPFILPDGGRIQAQPLPHPTVPTGDWMIARAAAAPYRLYEALKQDPPEILHLFDLGGVAVFAQEARILGAAFTATTFVLHATGGALRAAFASLTPSGRVEDLLTHDLERAVLERADHIVAPNADVLTFVAASGARIAPEKAAVLAPAPCPVKSGPVRPITRLIVPACPGARRNIAMLATTATRNPEAFAHFTIEARFDPTQESAADVVAYMAQRTPEFLNWRAVPAVSAPDLQGAALFAPYCGDDAPFAEILTPLTAGLPAVIGACSPIAAYLADPNQAIEVAPDALAQAVTDLKSTPLALDWIQAKAAWARFYTRPRPCPIPTEHQAAPPLVSLVIVHHNRPDTVETALASACAQDYALLEIVLVDDGSDSPAALAKLDALEGAGVRVIRQGNRYAGAARNVGALAARGDYVFFLDDDNVLKPGAITALVAAAQIAQADIVGCFSDPFSGDAPPAAPTAPRILQFGAAAADFGLMRNGMADANALYRREAFLRLGGMSEDYGVGKEDQEFCIRAVAAGARLHMLPEALFWARQAPNRVKTRHFSWAAGHFAVLRSFAAAPRSIAALVQGAFIERHEAEIGRWGRTPDALQPSAVSEPSCKVSALTHTDAARPATLIKRWRAKVRMFASRPRQ